MKSAMFKSKCKGRYHKLSRSVRSPIIMKMLSQQIPTWWDCVSDDKGGNMSQSNSQHKHGKWGAPCFHQNINQISAMNALGFVLRNHATTCRWNLDPSYWCHLPKLVLQTCVLKANQKLHKHLLAWYQSPPFYDCRTARQSNNLRIHLKIHSGEKWHMCFTSVIDVKLVVNTQKCTSDYQHILISHLAAAAKDNCNIF